MSKPLCIDLFCGLGGWTRGFLAEGYECIGFDIERHQYWVPEITRDDADGGKGTKPVEKRGWTQGCAISLGMEGANQKPRTRLVQYPAQLVLQDVLTLNGAQFRDAACIVASPPCQAYSYRAMPWKRAKALPPPSNELFDACFRIQREASEAAGRWIPMVVENVQGAQKWVGRARWHFGSYFLWGDVPALMPFTYRAQKMNPDGTNHGQGSWFAVADSKNRGSAVKVPSENGRRTDVGNGVRFTSRDCGMENAGLKFGGGWWHDATNNLIRKASSRSAARKAASAQIAEIPFELAQWIARCFKPDETPRLAPGISIDGAPVARTAQRA